MVKKIQTKEINKFKKFKFKKKKKINNDNYIITFSSGTTSIQSSGFLSTNKIFTF